MRAGGSFRGASWRPVRRSSRPCAAKLQEELGITIGNCIAWKVTEHAYSHALVRLHWCKVTQWEGDFEMREGQRMAWQQLPLQVRPVLEGSLPVLQWLSEERGVPFDARVYAADEFQK